MKAEKHEIESVEFRGAKGGIVSETRMRHKRPGQGGGPDYDYKHETGVHPTLEHAKEHLETALGHLFTGASKEGAKEEKAEGED